MARSDTIRAAIARELATVREEGERAIADLHAQLAAGDYVSFVSIHAPAKGATPGRP